MRADTGGAISKLEVTLPRQLILHGGGYEVCITFTTSSLLGFGLPASATIGLVGASVVGHLEREEQVREEHE